MDWVRFLDENNIHYVTRGPNTKRGEVSVACPLCGDDPSEHLGISLTSDNWGCHRDANHRGKAPQSLVKAILGCSGQQAGLIVKQYSHSDPDTLEAALASLEEDGADFELAEQARNQELGPQFDDFSSIKPRGTTRRFFKYLENRGYEDATSVIARYNLKCALTGRYKDRVIIPVRHSGELLGWTSRAIGATIDAPRYLASSDQVKTTVFNFDALKRGGQRLLVVEGPFDAIKIDNHNFTITQDSDVEFRATCTFGTSPTISQIAILRSLARNFDETWVLFDQGADHQGGELAQWIGAKQAYLPTGTDDPGELKTLHLDILGKAAFDGAFTLHLDALVASALRKHARSISKNLMLNNAFLKKLGRKP